MGESHLPAEITVLCAVDAFEAAPAGEVVSDDTAVCAGHLEVALALCTWRVHRSWTTARVGLGDQVLSGSTPQAFRQDSSYMDMG